MIYQKKTINNVPTKRPISNSAPVGNPIGTIISTYKKIQPRNYLYCDGSTFDETIYPALYLYLGTNVLPDYRECAMVGAEKNTTDVFDSTETNPSTGLPGTQNHDVYSQGEFKDDQLQGHTHNVTEAYSATATVGNPIAEYKYNQSLNPTTTGGVNNAFRVGTVTRGKRKAVYYYIKAVDGVDISDEDSFLNTVKDYLEEYTRNQNILADHETITIGTSSTTPTVMQYDGFLFVSCNASGVNQYITINVNGSVYDLSKNTTGSQNVIMTIPYAKGDRMYIVEQGNVGTSFRVRQYKLRDYTGR